MKSDASGGLLVTKVVATAQDGPRARVVLWDAATMRRRGVLKDAGVADVRYLGFSPRDGSKLLVLSTAGPFAAAVVSVYDWRSLKVLFTSPACSGAPSTAKVIAASWVNERMFGTCADEEVTLWKDRSVAGSSLYFEPQVMLYGVAFKRGMQTSVAPLPLDDIDDGGGGGGSSGGALERYNPSGSETVDRAVTGAANGYLYIWSGTFCKGVARAHDGSVAALTFMPDKSLLVSSGTDRVVRLWAPDLGCLGELTVDAVVCSIDLAVATPLVDKDGAAGGVNAGATPRGGATMLLLATTDGAIFERRVSDGRDPNGRVLVQGHSAGGVNAMDVNAKTKQIVTVGDDATLCVWNPSGSWRCPYRGDGP